MRNPLLIPPEEIASVVQFASFTRIRRVLGLSYPAALKMVEGVEQFQASERTLQVSIEGLRKKVGDAAANAIRSDLALQRQGVKRDWRSKTNARTPKP